MKHKKHLINRILSVLLVLCLVLSSPLHVMANAENADEPGSEPAAESPAAVSGEEVPAAEETQDLVSGTTGDVAWALDLTTGTLTLSGNGPTADYASGTNAEKAAPWFAYMGEITKVVVEEGVTALGERLFYGAAKLTDVVFPENSLTSIGEGAFRGCKALKSITLPASLTNLGRVSFYNDTALESVTIQGSMTELADQIFSGCTSLKHVTIPASVAALGASSSGLTTFNGCSALESITYGGTVEQWKLLLARGNTEEVKKESIAVTCADGTYYFDPNETLPDPDAGESGGEEGGNENILTGVTGDVTWTLDLTTGILTLSGQGATADYASGTNADKAAPWFADKDIIVKVVIEEGVTALGDRLFYGDSNLVEVVFPENSLTSIGEGTFRGCSSLVSITLPDSLTDLERVSFYGCSNLEKVVLGGANSKLDTLNDQTFNLCNNLKEITIPASMQTFNFSGTKGPLTNCLLETIYYTGTVAQWKAFLEGTNSSEVKKGSITVYCSDGIYIDGSLGNGIVYTLSDGVLTLEAKFDSGDMPDFASASELPWAADAATVTKVVVRNSITRIGAYAFADCVNIREVVYIGDEQGWNAIKEKSGSNNEPLFSVAPTYLASGQCGENVTYTYDPVTKCLTISGTGATYDYTSGSLTPWGLVREEIETLIVEDGVTYLGGYLFNKAYSLKSVTLPAGITELGTFTFGQCTSLTSLTLPEGLELIGSKTFSGCANLEEIRLPGTLKYIDMKAFENATALKDVYYNGTQGQWDQIVISTSALGNSTLLKATLHLLKTAQTFTDVPADSAYLAAVTYLTDNGYITAASDAYGVDDIADMELVLEALYSRAGAPGMYASARAWAVHNGLVTSGINQNLTIADLAYTLYRAAVLNGTAAEDAQMDAVVWCEQQRYFTDLENTDDTDREMTRGEASLVLAAYLQSAASYADRKAAQTQIIRSALAQGGDGKMYIYVPDLTTENAGSKPGDCTLVIFPDGKTMLIDSGINTSESIVLGMLQEFGITYLDYFVLSHPHADHVGNAVAVVNYLQNNGGGIGTMYDSGYDYKGYTQKVYDALDPATIVEHLEDGDTFAIGEVSVKVFNPTPELIEELKPVDAPGDEIVNNISLAMKFTYGTSTYLTGGDLYTSRELQLVAKYGNALQADVVKSNHHGAYTSNCAQWLDTVDPVITFVESDDIGSAPLAEMSAERGTAYYTFGMDGAILISMSNDKDYGVITQKDSVIRSQYTGQIGRNEKLIAQTPIVIEAVGQTAVGDSDFALSVSGGAPELTYQYSSSDASVVTVDAVGTVHVVGVGTAVITVTKAHAYYQTVSAEVTVTVNKGTQGALTIDAVEEKTVGDADFVLRVHADEGASLTFSSSDENVVKVDETGKVRIVGAGEAVITVVASKAGYEDAKAEVRVTVKSAPTDETEENPDQETEGSTPSDPPEEDQTPSDPDAIPATGDDAGILLWAGLMMISVCGLAVLLTRRRKCVQ